METNNKKTTRILAVLCIAVAVICIIGFFAKKHTIVIRKKFVCRPLK